MRLIESVTDVDFKTFPGGDKFSVLVGRHESTGSSEHHTVAIVKLPINAESDEHFHKEREEFYFIVEGQGLAIIDDDSYTIREGSLVHTKPNEKHRFKNTGDSELVYLVMTAPRWIPEDSHQ